jgi:hypothetical protein
MDEIKKEYDLCIQQPFEYKKKVNSISNLLLLKGNKKLKVTFLDSIAIKFY